MKLKTIGVVGAGTMGYGIAQTCAVRGYDVIMQDVTDEVVQKVLGSIQNSLGRLLGKEKISQADHDDALGRIQTATDISAMSGCDLVVEAASENMDIKITISKIVCSSAIRSIKIENKTPEAVANVF